ncbi:DNA-processing protein DprA [Caldalkalibacillus salinus]|uniref:DNA-processing protein DprA n=1 Tax=Caldalkalibacillus salinus TaxID=2803787 RepID=UPI00192406F3|nr:DNA-processing protein DprA [Caldalkalibacillus salinus]
MRDSLIALTLVPNIGWKTVHALLEQGFENDQAQMGKWSASHWKDTFSFLTPKQCQSLEHHYEPARVNTYLKEWATKNITVTTILDDAYPERLKNIYDPPWVLYTIGNRDLWHDPSMAFVGSRKASTYGKHITQRFVKALLEHGFVISSGMALGIDSISHWEALRHKGRTVAILGSGIDVIYPKQHRSLYSQIVKEGLMISEYPPGTRPHPGFFPRRNRIISGLSVGTIVVEANEKSGSLITAHQALEQGREVFAIPGSIFDQQSKGTNLLIQKHGAKLVIQVEDILEELPDYLIPQKHDSFETGLNPSELVDDKEKEILNNLQERQHFNDLLNKGAFSVPELTSVLLRLEMKGLIHALPGSYYHKA